MFDYCILLCRLSFKIMPSEHELLLAYHRLLDEKGVPYDARCPREAERWVRQKVKEFDESFATIAKEAAAYKKEFGDE